MNDPRLIRVLLASLTLATFACGSLPPSEPAAREPPVAEPAAPEPPVAEPDAPEPAPTEDVGNVAGRLVEWSRHGGQVDPNVAHSGKPSLKLEVGEGCGGRGYSAKSATLMNLRPKQTYVVSYGYRYAECADVEMQVGANGPGDSTSEDFPLQGTQSGWLERSFEFYVADNPTGWSVVVDLGRRGACADFKGTKFQNNFVWLGELSVKPRPN